MTATPTDLLPLQAQAGSPGPRGWTTLDQTQRSRGARPRRDSPRDHTLRVLAWPLLAVACAAALIAA